MKEVILWGGTGQSRVLREALAYSGFQVVAIFDNRPIRSPFPDVPIHLGQEGFHAWLASRTTATTLHACVAIGGSRGSDRLSLLQWLQQQGVQPLTVIHPRAFVASDAHIGDGAQILAMSATCSNVTLGRAVIVNTSASIDHDCVIGDGVHIGPGANLAGEVCVGEYAFIGAGAVVLPRLKIGRSAIVGAGAVVIRDVAADEVVVGNPAVTLRR
ncbi:NeuD/PglB/VioB family sugar acetyltransferase [Rhodanobacter sp. 115]|uniref:NeuD/PglB/VioB family sugar acetyltransferase n=1 Tax=Rhodanobacter sp. FW021-MT20 TaxID=1162282 RepID=UPI000260F03C|nr:NeuD/PglB/VioB family sugar acetyltransferase [Rhodanobacter sp. 115]EIL97330.1 hexapeptide repeat-containing transferase [Rhodanobacter sp. 115]